MNERLLLFTSGLRRGPHDAVWQAIHGHELLLFTEQPFVEATAAPPSTAMATATLLLFTEQPFLEVRTPRNKGDR